ncbi:MAG: aminopeptidase [Desulfitibacter sp. BRH_c19]|nr:MAG: aminopeptidase [Desulfitibacter sp. BRH_c19]
MSKTADLASNLINYSCEIKPTENILITFNGESALPLVKELIRQAYEVGANPFVQQGNPIITREIFKNANLEQLKQMAEFELPRMQKMDAFVGIGAGLNPYELSGLPEEIMQNYNRIFSETVLKERVNNTKWVVLRYPTSSMALQAKMSLEDFETFYYDVCTMDYAKMSKSMDTLLDLMTRTDKVRIVGKDTDISFSIKEIPVIKCDGKRNIPDGEVYTAPVKDSVNGYIKFNCPSNHQGFTYENISFKVKDGKIIEASANDTPKINELLNTDGGARYFGEFAIGVNPYILSPMNDTLFDEKIAGSFHLTPGKCYKEASNGNSSAIHWDLVNIQTPKFGGGEIYFDNTLIRKDGLFVIEDLKRLNPANLKS